MKVGVNGGCVGSPVNRLCWLSGVPIGWKRIGAELLPLDRWVFDRKKEDVPELLPITWPHLSMRRQPNEGSGSRTKRLCITIEADFSL